MNDLIADQPLNGNRERSGEESGKQRLESIPHTKADRPGPIDLLLILTGPTMMGAGYDIFKGSLHFTILGLAAGFVLAAVAWLWPRISGPGLIVLSIPGLLFSLAFTLYTLGMPQALVMLWGSAAFLAGGVGVLHRRLASRLPRRYFFLGSLLAVFLIYFIILWPPQGRAILLSLPIHPQAEGPQFISAEAGGIWARYWTAPQMSIQEAQESLKGPLEADGWTIVDSSIQGLGIPIVSAQRGAYSVEVIYEPHAPRPYWPTGAYMAAYVRRAPARTFPRFDLNR